MPDLQVRTDGRERRVWGQEIQLAPGEARADGLPQIVGYGAVFNRETVIGNWWREQIAPTAFDQAIGRDDVRGLWNHDPNYVLGRTTAGTLSLSTDARGLKYVDDPPDTTWARDLITSIQRGDVSQSSFAFRVLSERWDEPTEKGGLPLRTILEVELFDVSPVTYPAYEETTVTARDAAAALIRPPARDGASPQGRAHWTPVRCRQCTRVIAKRAAEARGVEIKCPHCNEFNYVLATRGASQGSETPRAKGA